MFFCVLPPNRQQLRDTEEVEMFINLVMSACKTPSGSCSPMIRKIVRVVHETSRSLNSVKGRRRADKRIELTNAPGNKGEDSSLRHPPRSAK